MKLINWVLKNIWFIVGVIFFMLWVSQCNKDPEVIEVPVEIEVEIPVVEKVHDTILIPVDSGVVVEVDSIYYKEYLKLKDSVQKDSAYKEAIKIREYNQEFDDDFQTTTVYSKTRGTLLEQSVSYKTKPKTIIVKDTIEIKTKNSFALGAEIGVPTIQNLDATPVIKGGVEFTNKKGNAFSLSYDTEGRAWVGYKFKIFKKR